MMEVSNIDLSCPYCGSGNSIESQNCSQCGAPLGKNSDKARNEILANTANATVDTTNINYKPDQGRLGCGLIVVGGIMMFGGLAVCLSVESIGLGEFDIIVPLIVATMGFATFAGGLEGLTR